MSSSEDEVARQVAKHLSKKPRHGDNDDSDSDASGDPVNQEELLQALNVSRQSWGRKPPPDLSQLTTTNFTPVHPINLLMQHSMTAYHPQVSQNSYSLVNQRQNLFMGTLPTPTDPMHCFNAGEQPTVPPLAVTAEVPGASKKQNPKKRKARPKKDGSETKSREVKPLLPELEVLFYKDIDKFFIREVEDPKSKHDTTVRIAESVTTGSDETGDTRKYGC
jgi:hypothetical protein